MNFQTCFFRQFGRSVVRADYLTLRKGFIMVCNNAIEFVLGLYDFNSKSYLGVAACFPQSYISNMLSKRLSHHMARCMI